MWGEKEGGGRSDTDNINYRGSTGEMETRSILRPYMTALSFQDSARVAGYGEVLGRNRGQTAGFGIF